MKFFNGLNGRWGQAKSFDRIKGKTDVEDCSVEAPPGAICGELDKKIQGTGKQKCRSMVERRIDDRHAMTPNERFFQAD